MLDEGSRSSRFVSLLLLLITAIFAPRLTHCLLFELVYGSRLGGGLLCGRETALAGFNDATLAQLVVVRLETVTIKLGPCPPTLLFLVSGSRFRGRLLR